MWSFGTTMTMPKDSESTSKIPSPPAQPDPIPPVQAQTLPETRPSILSQRSLKQLGLFFGGAGFLSLATLITRRSVMRKTKATIPKFYTQSNRPVNKIGSDSSLIALEALNLATLNVLGFAIMMTGGISWAFDISNIDDLRRMARKHIGPPGGKTDEEAEREVEEWVAKVLLRKEQHEEAANAADQTAKTSAITRGKSG
ncbi:hypothetical protein FHL15_009084 [Xylaria flabelliformis]|uniref:Altered inheritance of mitochondria protein 11 n=1 Tax=Xylaria flabelliformis TaxID=2512241 RepID=A0A553HPV5_9PEZI|nr:hypothetical protein FHL15_009084 [Xylaria flabelliformis]